MLFRISILDKENIPVLYRRPFLGIAEISPEEIANLVDFTREKAEIDAGEEKYSIRPTDSYLLIVSHDGDHIAVEQLYTGLKGYISEAELDKEALREMRKRLKPSVEEVMLLKDAVEEERLKEIKRIKPSKEASEEEMQELFLRGELEKVIEIYPKTPKMAAMYIKSAILLESFPLRYHRADREYVERAFSRISDYKVEKLLRAYLDHVVSSSRSLEIKHLEIYRENRNYYRSLIERDPIRSVIILYPLRDIELYKYIAARFDGYRSNIAMLYRDLRELPKRANSVEDMLSIKPYGSGLEFVLTLASAAFARELSRYIAEESDVSLLVSEVEIIGERFKRLIEEMKHEPPVPVSILAHSLSRLSAHVYRLLALSMLYQKRPKGKILKGFRKSIDEIMSLFYELALYRVIKPPLLAKLSSTLLEAMYAITKARGAKYSSREVRYINHMYKALATLIDYDMLYELYSTEDRNSFIHYLDIFNALSELYLSLNDKLAPEIKRALERSILSTYLEEYPIYVLEVLDALAYAYPHAPPNEKMLRELIGYLKRLVVYPILLKVALFRMKERLREQGYENLALIAERELRDYRKFQFIVLYFNRCPKGRE